MNNVKQTDTWPASASMASCYQRMVPGRIGAVELLAGCFTFWECISLMAQDIAASGKGAEVRAAIGNGTTARQLMRDLYGVNQPKPSISHNATPESETRILRKWIGFQETDIRRAARQKRARITVETRQSLSRCSIAKVLKS